MSYESQEDYHECMAREAYEEAENYQNEKWHDHLNNHIPMKETDRKFSKSWYRAFLANVKNYEGSGNPYEIKIAEMVEYIDSLHDKIDKLKTP